MLSDSTVNTVKATVPALQAHAVTITSVMYRTMSKDYPQIKSIFNMSHLRENPNACPGESKASEQATTLANSIVAYATYIDNLGVLGDAVEMMVEKHVSFHVLPEHYLIVKICLMDAIREVLGEAATDEVVGAWEEAYTFLADLLIAKEEEVRKKRAAEKGGWEGYKPFLVSKKVPESDEITSFYLKPKDGKPTFNFLAGQYVSVRIPKGRIDGWNDHDLVRNYSLSCRPGEDFLRISVKREEGQKADIPAGVVSNHLHSKVEVGGEIELGIPCGVFVVDSSSSSPLVLLSAGVGVTPMMSMLEEVLEASPKRSVVFVQSVRGASSHPMKKRIEYLASQHVGNLKAYAFYSQNDEGSCPPDVFTGRVTKEKLLELVPNWKESVFYFCGPLEYQKCVQKMLLEIGVEQKNVRFESFGPTQSLA